jgi:hypothetical protein
VTTTVHADDPAGANVVVPVSGRTRTELVVTNLEPDAVPLTVTFYGPDGERAFTTMTLAGHGTAALDELPPAPGMIRVSSTMTGARITARANGAPAIPIDALTSEHVLSGVTNVGVANPWSVPATITLTLHDAEGQQLGQLHRLVPAFEVVQLDGVSAASVRVTSQVSVYAYASIGAALIPGTGVAAATTVAPQCAEPASLGVANTPAEGWIVVMQPETTPDTITNVLPTGTATPSRASTKPSPASPPP